MSRDFRVDKLDFETKGEAIKFVKDHKLLTLKLYLSQNGKYKIKAYSKTKTDELLGSFDIDDSNQIVFIKNKSIIQIDHKSRKSSTQIDGKKFKAYIDDNGYNKKDLCNLLYKSRVFINDAIRYNKMDTLCLEKLCEFFNVPNNYFDPVMDEPEIQEDTQEPKEIGFEQIHDDLMALIASNRRLEVLMQNMIDMWRND